METYQNEHASPGNLARLGLSMKKYAKAIWIEIGGVVVLLFIASFMMMGSFMVGDPDAMFGVENGIYVLIGGMIALEIFVLVRYIQFTLQLKVAGEVTNSPLLQKAWKYLLAAILSSVVLRIYSEVFMVGIIRSFLTLDYAGMDLEQMLDAVDALAYTAEVLSIFVTIIPVAFQLMFAVLFHKWTQSLAAEHHGDFLYMALEQGANLIRIGTFLSFIPLIELVGALILPLGYGKTGKALELISPNHQSTSTYENQMPYGHTPFDITTQPRPPYTRSSTGSNDGPASQTQMGGAQNPVRPPNSGNPRKLCPFCGTKLPNPGAAFCSMCGKEIQ